MKLLALLSIQGQINFRILVICYSFGDSCKVDETKLPVSSAHGLQAFSDLLRVKNVTIIDRKQRTQLRRVKLLYVPKRHSSQTVLLSSFDVKSKGHTFHIWTAAQLPTFSSSVDVKKATVPPWFLYSFLHFFQPGFVVVLNHVHHLRGDFILF